MAEQATAQDENDLPLSDANVVGIIQRALRECTSYMDRPAAHVDPRVCVRYLTEAYHWALKLPLPAVARPPAPPADGNVATKRR